MNIGNYTYHRLDGTVLASCNSNVPVSQRFIEFGCYTREENTWDSSVTWYDPDGLRIDRDRLPWVVADAARQLANKRTVVVQVYTDSVVLRVNGRTKRVGIGELQDAACQDDTGDGLVPYYSALLTVIAAKH